MISNICRANFNGGRTAQGNNRYQWDYGQILEISGIENLPDPFTAQFSNTPVLGTAKTTVGTGGRVEIPNEYFVSGQNIYCFIVLHTDEDDGRTVYIATIPVTKRPKPIDDPITPTQQSTIDTAIAALQAGVAKAEGFAGDAEEQAGIAQSAATTATEAAETATGAVADVEAAATRAEQAAEGAEASATAAEASATDAETAKTAALAAKSAAETAAANAEQSATDAGNYAGLAEAAEQDAQAAKTAAEASATAAAGGASAASGSASQSAQKASEASESATAAQTSATNAEAAKTGAETAQTAAETAQGKAEQAQANAEEAEATAEWYAERVERFLPTDTASGEIASFPDGADGVPMQSVVVSMEPVQDLHGYDHPWPAGATANLFKATPYGGEYNKDVGVNLKNYQTMPYEITSDGKFVIDVQTAWRGRLFATDVLTAGDYTMRTYGNSSSIRFTLYVTDADLLVKSVIRNQNAAGWGEILTVSVSDGDRIAVFLGANTAEKIITEFQVNSGTTIAPIVPFENVCPISGWTGAHVVRTGANIWDEELEGGSINITNGENTPNSKTIRSKNYISVIPGTSYYMLLPWAYIFWYDINKNYIKYVGNGVTEDGAVHGKTIVAPNNAYYMRFRCSGTYGTTYNHDISINYPATDHDYHAYTGNNTYSVSWETEAGTVYGGTLDVVSGELVVDRAMVDLGTLNYGLNNHAILGQYFWADVSRLGIKRTGGYEITIYPSICSAFKCVSRNASVFVNGTYCFDGVLANVTQVQFKDSAYSDPAEFKATMSGVQLVYELATPITYHLTPQEVRTLLGTNNVWSDAGETAVTYKADVQLYIDKRISALS